MTPAQVAHIMSMVEEYAVLREHGSAAQYDAAGRAVEAALRDAPQAEPVAWHVNFRGSSHLLTSLESVDLTDCIVTPLYPEPRAPDNTLKDRLLAALERAAGAESALRRLADKTEPLTQTRGYHALVQVIYELQQDGNYSDEEGEETSALVELLRAIEATPSAPTAVEPDERDTERMNWLEQVGTATIQRMRRLDPKAPKYWDIEFGNDENTASGQSLRAAIDAARASKGTP